VTTKRRREADPPALPPVEGVTVVRRVATPARRAKFIRLLSVLMDKPEAPPDASPAERTSTDG
jgi:hypothetical protein